MPTVSVLMPVYNGLPHVEEAVASVTGQDFDDWELVISDNGSVDGTREYLAGLRDVRIRVFLQPENLGIFGNVNFLLSEARAAVAKILCSDDELLPHCLSEVVDVTARLLVPVIGCYAVGDVEELGAGGRYRLQGRLPNYLDRRQSQLAFVTFGNMMGNLSCAICRPAVLLAHGSFDQGLPYAGDYEGWARFSRIQGFAVHRRELVRVRRHDRQASVLLNKHNELVTELSEVLRRLLPFVEEDHRTTVIEHWARDVYPTHWPHTVRLLLAGQVRPALYPWLHLPFGIRWWQTLSQYFPRRIRRCDDSRIARTLFRAITGGDSAALASESDECGDGAETW